MAAIISLKRADVCADCGAALPVGTRAKWYRNGKVYGISCHARPANLPARRGGRGVAAIEANVLLDDDPSVFDLYAHAPGGE